MCLLAGTRLSARRVNPLFYIYISSIIKPKMKPNKMIIFRFWVGLEADHHQGRQRIPGNNNMFSFCSCCLKTEQRVEPVELMFPVSHDVYAVS